MLVVTYNSPARLFLDGGCTNQDESWCLEESLSLSYFSRFEGRNRFHPAQVPPIANSQTLGSNSSAAGSKCPRFSTSSSLCRSESIDSLYHLSGDGFIHSWLPSYVNFPNKLLNQNPSLAFCYLLSICPPEDGSNKALMTIWAGRMIEKSSREATTSEIVSCDIFTEGKLDSDGRWCQDSKLEYCNSSNSGAQIRKSPTNSRMQCEEVNEKEKEGWKEKTMQLTAHPCKGQLKLVCTNDGGRQIKVLWWKVTDHKIKRTKQYQSIFTATSSEADRVHTKPDLEIEIIPNQCRISAAENSNDRVLVISCNHCGACKSEPQQKR